MHVSLRRLGVGTLAALIATAGFATTAYAATEPAFPGTSDAPVYLVDADTNAQYAKGSTIDWDAALGVILSAGPTPTRLPYVAGSLTETPFISAPGAERTPASWKVWADEVDLNGVGANLPNVTPANFGNGSAASILSAGGTYSLGVAYKSGPSTVTAAYFTTINVDAGGAFKFATPAAPVVVTDVVTTTTLSALPTSVEAGSTSVLTATVSASKAVTGNVEFFKGTTSLGTVGLASGSASKTVTIGTTGTHTYSAKFVENTVGSDKFLTSTSADVTVTGTPPTAPVTPNGPTESTLNAGTANGATITYDAVTHKATMTVNASNNGKTVNVFGYSTPTYLGQQTVAGGQLVVDVSVLGLATHKLAITDPSTGDVLAWASFDKTDAATSPSFAKAINADVAALVPADGEFSLTNLSGATVNLTNPALVNGASVVSGQLGTFKVTDLRQVSKPGWKLETNVAQFVKGTDTIEASALGIDPKIVSQAGTGATAPTLGAATTSGSASYPWNFATLAGNSFSGVSTYNADLVFTAPAGKPAGTYNSTLTLTLISD